jgi:hypothetical protein
MDDSLLCPPIMDQISPYNGDRTISKANSELRQVVESGECGDLWVLVSRCLSMNALYIRERVFAHCLCSRSTGRWAVQSSSLVCPTPILSRPAHSVDLPIPHQCRPHQTAYNMHTEIVTNNDVPSTCFICVIEPVSCAWKARRTLKEGETIRTVPSWLPRKRLSEPEQTQLISLLSKKDLLSSSGGLTWLTSKKSNVFHCIDSLAYVHKCAPSWNLGLNKTYRIQGHLKEELLSWQ